MARTPAPDTPDETPADADEMHRRAADAGIAAVQQAAGVDDAAPKGGLADVTTSDVS